MSNVISPVKSPGIFFALLAPIVYTGCYKAIFLRIQNLGMSKREVVFTACIQHQQGVVTELKQALLEVQESANAEKGGEESDSSKEQMQYEADRYARQLDQGRQALQVMNSFDPSAAYVVVKPGAVVVTDKLNLIVGASIGKIHVDGQVFVTISPESPLYESMAGKKKGEAFSFRDQQHTIADIY